MVAVASRLLRKVSKMEIMTTLVRPPRSPPHQHQHQAPNALPKLKTKGTDKAVLDDKRPAIMMNETEEQENVETVYFDQD